MTHVWDAVVVGGGHNGLVSAAYLARAGMRTLVLERRHVLGGAAVTEKVVPGFRFSVASYVVSLFRPEIISQRLGKVLADVVIVVRTGRVKPDHSRQFSLRLAGRCARGGGFRHSPRHASGSAPSFVGRQNGPSPSLRPVLTEGENC